MLTFMVYSVAKMMMMLLAWKLIGYPFVNITQYLLI